MNRKQDISAIWCLMSECAFPVWGVTIIGLCDNKGAYNFMQRKVTAFVPKFQYKIHFKKSNLHFETDGLWTWTYPQN